MKKLISLLLTILVFAACSDKEKQLREALEFAGDNRPQLEAVLEHYRTVDNDPLKLDAAKYLIANMPAHYSYRDTAAINSFYSKALEILGTGPSGDWQRDTLREIGDKYYAGIMEDIIPDAWVITADYLIYNIDHAFNAWRTRPWSQHVKYEEFRERILPYKITERQSFDPWRDTLVLHYTDSLSKVPPTDLERNTIYGAIEIVRKELHTKELDMKFRILWEERNGIPMLSAATWVRMTYGDCRNFVDMGTSVFRSLGLPACVDFVPLWGRNNNGHSWFAFTSDQGRLERTINSMIEPAGQPFFPYDRFPKVFRATYAMNPRILDYNKTAKYRYKFDICQEDVTEQYNLTSDIDIELFDGIKLKDKYVYIGMFSATAEDKWKVLDFGTVKRGKAHFEKMGRNMLYIALRYDNAGLIPISKPFILHKSGKIEYIDLDDSSMRTVTLKRKYYESLNDVEMRRRILGARIQCANRADFSDARTLYTIQTTAIPDKIALEPDGKYRYWRYLSADSTYGSVAEVEYFDRDGNILEGRPLACRAASADTIGLAQDGKWLTNFETGQPNGNWVGQDLGTARSVQAVRVIPRSDDNDIHPGHKYELRYMNSNGRWKSLGRKTATDNVLEYDNVPVKCLLWLRNLTTGSEERAFIYNGPDDIVWW